MCHSTDWESNLNYVATNYPSVIIDAKLKDDDKTLYTITEVMNRLQKKVIIKTDYTPMTWIRPMTYKEVINFISSYTPYKTYKNIRDFKITKI